MKKKGAEDGSHLRLHSNFYSILVIFILFDK